MRISDRLIPAALFTVSLGLVSAFGFEGSAPHDGIHDGMHDGMAPAAAVDTMPRVTRPAPGLVPPMAVPNVPPGANASLNTNLNPSLNPSLNPTLPATRPLTRSLAPTHPLTPGEAFLTGTQALRAGNTTAGIHALEYAAENGHALAEWKLGRMYADGDHVVRDDLRAFDYFQDIVDNHSDDTLGTPQARFVANAYVALGGYFLNGIPNSPVKPDALRARDLYAYAASYFGDAEAQYRLGRMLLEGQGGPRDPWQAARWLKLSADKRHIQAQVLLGITMFKGDGIPRQAARGLMYLIVAHDAAKQDQSIAALEAWALSNASDDQRAMALTYLEAWTQGRRD